MKDLDLNNLDLSNIGAWPTAVKIALIIIVCAGVAAGGFFLDTQKPYKSFYGYAPGL